MQQKAVWQLMEEHRYEPSPFLLNFQAFTTWMPPRLKPLSV